jgi:hypothetical protein
MRTPLAICFILASAFVTGGEGAAQESVVITQLDSAVVIAKNQGYGQVGERFLGALDQGESEEVRAGLKAGVEYLILGVCDSDCTDVDLIWEDANGTQIDSDLLDDDAPVVGGRVARDGAYIIRVSMANCSVEPCNYGVQIFSQAR